MDFDPLLFSLPFAWLLSFSFSFSFSLSLYLAKRIQKDLSLTNTFQALVPETSLSPSIITLVGSLTFCYHFFLSQLLSLPLRTLFESLSVRASLVSYYKTWSCSPNTRTKQSSINELALTLLLHLLLHVMVFFLYLP